MDGLERSTGPSGYTAAGDVSVWRQASAETTRVHSCPAWKLVAGVGGPVEVEWAGRRVRSRSVLVPAGLAHRAAAGAGFVAVFVDAAAVAGGPTGAGLPAAPVGTGDLCARRWTEVGQQVADPGGSDALTEAVVAALGPPRTDRLAVRLRQLGVGTTPSALALELGWSVGYLRDVLRAESLPTLGQLLRWARVRAAVASLTQAPPAHAAAAAGFSDQAHLTRVASGTLGRTPGSIRRTVLDLQPVPGPAVCGPRPSAQGPT